LLWISYLDPYGKPRHGVAYLSQSVANSPNELGDNAKDWIRGVGQPSVGNPRHDLSRKSELGNCQTFTEPSLFHRQGETYLAANCLVMKNGQRRVDLERLVLLREQESGYEFVGDLLTGSDAARFGVERLEQAELTTSKDGDLLLLATPMSGGANHAGCFVLEVESLDPPRMARHSDGSLKTPVFVTDSGSKEKGPGACSYDPNSETGVIIVRRDFEFDKKPPRIAFSLLATGYHP
ncbi:MAG: hypothetical protein HKM24_03860, partial [Gammaproteobacteria bacterium]|nr:hypothetical protein [Gammaproteobacteria bacterium]